jgi:hypothetical protein
MPIAFEPGRDNGFLARGPGFTLSLSNKEAALSTGSGEVLRMRFRGARSGVRITPIDPLPGRSNYLEGNQPARWRRDVPQFARVKYENIYPGVDAVFHGAAGELEFDFMVAPGADTSPIALLFDGAEQLQLDDSGDSILHYGPARFRLRKPVLYQESAGLRHSADGRYVRRGDKELGFEIGPYDSTDPNVLEYHMLLMKLSGIDGIIVDWYGQKGTNGDINSLLSSSNALIDKVDDFGLKCVPLFEQFVHALGISAGRARQTLQIARLAGRIWFWSPGFERNRGHVLVPSAGRAPLLRRLLFGSGLFRAQFCFRCGLFRRGFFRLALRFLCGFFGRHIRSLPPVRASIT